MGPPTFVVTARLDDASSHAMDLLRKRYFPPGRNFIPAHLTLFHKLPIEGVEVLEQALGDRRPGPFDLEMTEPYSLGRGVAIRVVSGLLTGLRDELASRLDGYLSPQDRQPFRPHVTVQNKVSAEEARECLAELDRTWQPRRARVEAVDVWRYLDGPWSFHARLSLEEGR